MKIKFSLWLLAVFFFSSLMIGCQGATVSSMKSATVRDQAAQCSDSAKRLLYSPLRMMTSDEYKRSVKLLLGQNVDLSGVKYPEMTNVRNFNKTIDVNTALDTDVFMNTFYVLSDNVAKATFKVGTNLPSLAQCPSGGANCDAQIAERAIKNFFRRPAMPEEILKFTSLLGTSSLGNERFQTAFQYLLNSPNFLFIGSSRNSSAPMEIAAPHSSVVVRNPFEFAELISFMITSASTPEWLISLAETGELNSETSIKTSIQKLVSSSDFYLNDFFRRMFNTNKLLNYEFGIKKPPAGFQSIQEVAQLANIEVNEIVNDIVTQEKPFSEIFLATSIPMNKKTAPMYGVDNPNLGDAFQVQPIPEKLAGFAGTFSTNFALSLGDEPNFVKRALKLNDRFYCGIGGGAEAPPDVPELPPIREGVSLRQMLDEHADNPKCAICHANFDPYGVPNEVMDGFGHYRSTYSNGDPIDTVVNLKDLRLNTQRELVNAIYDKKSMEACFVKQLTTYSLGRLIESRECWGKDEALTAEVDGKNQTITDLLFTISKGYLIFNGVE